MCETLDAKGDFALVPYLVTGCGLDVMGKMFNLIGSETADPWLPPSHSLDIWPAATS
jgi:hypothetical protein